MNFRTIVYLDVSPYIAYCLENFRSEIIQEKLIRFATLNAQDLCDLVISLGIFYLLSIAVEGLGIFCKILFSATLHGNDIYVMSRCNNNIIIIIKKHSLSLGEMGI